MALMVDTAAPDRLPRLLLCLFLIGTAGCVNRNIEIRTADVIVPTGRIRYQAIEPSETAKTGPGWSGLSVDGEISYSHGNDNKPLRVGDTLGLRRSEFTGPLRIRNRASVVDTTVNVRTGLSVKEMFRLEPMAGIELTSIDLEVVGGGVQESDTTTAVGFMTGLRGAFQPHALFEIYGQASAGWLAGGRGDNRGIRTEKYETGARLLPFEHLGIFAGYRWAQYNQWREPDESDSEFDFRGPVFGVEFRL
ncbi:MAG: hypothetical protein AB8G23_08615 [Myxococcota bacterium]